MLIKIAINSVAMAVGLLAISGVAEAKPMPNLHTLQMLIGKVPIPVTVIEPHLSTQNHSAKIVYTGYRVDDVLAAVLGSKWAGGERDIEFTAADGYVSRITPAKFKQDQAFVVVARQDGKPFAVNNQFQQEPNVALGPYYLVWDNIQHPNLIAEGATQWPYQIVEVSQVKSADSVLLPGVLKARYQAHAKLAQTLCLTCHQVNGYGGTKMPINLSARVKLMSESYFMDWVLKPRAIKPNTHMPAFMPALPEDQREATARMLYEYLYALPVIQ